MTIIAVAPLAALPYATNALIDVVAKRAAAWLNLALSSPLADLATASPSPLPVDPGRALDRVSTPTADEGPPAAHGAAAERPANAGGRDGRATRTPTKPRARVIYVGPDAVKGALPAASRPTAAWTDGVASSPAGVRFTAVGGLASWVRVGDILVEAEGQRLHDFSELITVVGRAYERRSKTVVGRLWRGGELWSVVVEPGW